MNKPTLTRKKSQVAKIVDASQEVFLTSADKANELAFMSKCFIQATLPHSDPGDVRGWGRRGGNYSLSIQPGGKLGPDNEWKSFGVPYGSIPRLILAWANAEAVKTNSRTIKLGKSFSEFLDKLGYQATGGKKGDLTRVKNQAMRLFSSKLSLVYSVPGRTAVQNALLADRADFFWDPLHPEQQNLWESQILLSQALFDTFKASPVPLDWRVLKALKQSPMALDLYFWLSHRMFKLEKPVQIPWEVLAQQFGSEYGCVRDFKKKVRKHLIKIRAIWTDLCVEAEHENFIELSPSHLLIQPTKSKEQPDVIPQNASV